MYYQHPYPHYPAYRQYPSVNISMFEQSVVQFQKAVAAASTLLKKFSDRQFAKQLMTAAQSGNQNEVNRLIKSIGITLPMTIQYTPSGLILTIHAQGENLQCCDLSMILKWGR
ncbi:hypothetical protein A8F94_13010 [Bacillus sp. FJAT-27225]|uniref:hypothetical protein n=1 Tax=Bacillus sp. FJAT-27225 TaxID=1743144 RepID=UPI00080C330A|nr:hypothetical protein [Bacillus sp. FJAT-27225]OCA85787.1 hypothetical protein A8F94_13010 [Bacillus sp. FJAT-27225]